MIYYGFVGREADKLYRDLTKEERKGDTPFPGIRFFAKIRSKILFFYSLGKKEKFDWIKNEKVELPKKFFFSPSVPESRSLELELEFVTAIDDDTDDDDIDDGVDTFRSEMKRILVTPLLYIRDRAATAQKTWIGTISNDEGMEAGNKTK